MTVDLMAALKASLDRAKTDRAIRPRGGAMSLPINLEAIAERNEQVSAAFSAMGDGAPMPTFMRDHFYYDIPALVRYLHGLEQAHSAVVALTLSTDGDEIDGDANIPIGEIRRALAEAGR